MWLTKIDKHCPINSKVELTLKEIQTHVRRMGGEFDLENNTVVFRNPYTKTTCITTPFCNACEYEHYKDRSICRSCTCGNNFEWKDWGVKECMK